MKFLFPCSWSRKNIPGHVCTVTQDELKPILSSVPSTSILQTLPAEMIFSILDHLDTVSIVCLQKTNRFFRSFIPIDHTKLDRCTKWLITCRLEQDLPDVMEDWGEPLICALCKFKRVRQDFTGDSALRVLASSVGRRPKYVFTSPLDSGKSVVSAEWYNPLRQLQHRVP